MSVRRAPSSRRALRCRSFRRARVHALAAEIEHVSGNPRDDRLVVPAVAPIVPASERCIEFRREALVDLGADVEPTTVTEIAAIVVTRCRDAQRDPGRRVAETELVLVSRVCADVEKIESVKAVIVELPCRVRRIARAQRRPLADFCPGPPARGRSGEPPNPRIPSDVSSFPPIPPTACCNAPIQDSSIRVPDRKVSNLRLDIEG